MGTLDYKCAYYDESIDPVKPTYSGQKIYIFWHEYILFPLYLRGHCNLTMLLSRHPDTDILTRMAYHMGFEFVRGSSNRGGVAALAGTGAPQRPDEFNDHARWPPRTAPNLGAGTGLSRLETGFAAGGDGLRLRPAVAIAHLGSSRRPPAVQPRAGGGQPGDFGARSPGPRRIGRLPPASRTASQSTDAGSRSLGRIGHPQTRRGTAAAGADLAKPHPLRSGPLGGRIPSPGNADEEDERR